MKKILLVIIISILCVSMFMAFSLKVMAASTPSGIVYSVPITLTNKQSVATPAPFQQMISIDSSKYSSYEASNLQNIEFFDASGNVIPSWLESGNSASSATTIYWLNIANGIPAGSSVTIYLGFASTTTNLFNGQTIGEAPALSSTYGQYDDGASVFSFYDNFAGNTLSSLWADNSAQTRNTFMINNGITVEPAQEFNNWTAITSAKTFSQGITEFYGTIPTDDNGEVTFDGIQVGLVSQSGWDCTIGAVAGDYGLITKDGGNWDTAPGLSFGADNIYSLIIPSAASSLRMAQVNYGSTISGNSNPPSLPQPIGFQNQERTGLTLGPIYWIRERAYPPNGVMPAAAINGQSSPSPLSNPIVIGGIVAAVIAAVGAAVYFGVIAGGGSAAGSAGGAGAAGAAASAAESAGTVGNPTVSESSNSDLDSLDELKTDDSSFLDSLYNSSNPTTVGTSNAGSNVSEGVGSGPSLGGGDFLNDLYNDAAPPTAGTGQPSSIDTIISDLLSSEEGFLCIPFL